MEKNVHKEVQLKRKLEDSEAQFKKKINDKEK